MENFLFSLSFLYFSLFSFRTYFPEYYLDVFFFSTCDRTRWNALFILETAQVSVFLFPFPSDDASPSHWRKKKKKERNFNNNKKQEGEETYTPRHILGLVSAAFEMFEFCRLQRGFFLLLLGVSSDSVSLHSQDSGFLWWNGRFSCLMCTKTAVCRWWRCPFILCCFLKRISHCLDNTCRKCT